MKLAALDVKTTFCFSRFGGGMGSGLFSSLIYFAISKCFQDFFFVLVLQQARNAFEYA